MNVISNESNIVITNEVFTRDCLYVYLLQLNTLNGIETRTFVREDEDTIIFNNVKDGFYIIGRVEIPLFNSPYYYDSGKFYYNDEEVDMQSILEDDNISKEYFNYFLLNNLRQCYVSICQLIFNARGSIKCSSNNVDLNLIYKRDLVWSAINVIKFMAESNRFEEAERLLERITGCNGLCSEKFNNCGCHGMRM